eukprot:7382088-Prymnesium_polylepis.1
MARPTPPRAGQAARTSTSMLRTTSTGTSTRTSLMTSRSIVFGTSRTVSTAICGRHRPSARGTRRFGAHGGGAGHMVRGRGGRAGAPP